ncbi:hypothetical protein BJ508DRAFT_336947, partial [Ascobolus immersus RN42]
MGPKRGGRQPRRRRPELRIRDIVRPPNENDNGGQAEEREEAAPRECDCFMLGEDNRPHLVHGRLELEIHEQWRNLNVPAPPNEEEATKRLKTLEAALQASKKYELDKLRTKQSKGSVVAAAPHHLSTSRTAPDIAHIPRPFVATAKHPTVEDTNDEADQPSTEAAITELLVHVDDQNPQPDSQP